MKQNYQFLNNHQQFHLRRRNFFAKFQKDNFQLFQKIGAKKKQTINNTTKHTANK
jgi:hypothetical protein